MSTEATESESGPILRAALASLSSRQPEPIVGIASVGMSERCVEVPWVAAHLGDESLILDVGWAMSPPEWFGVLLERREQGCDLVGIDIIDPQRVRTRYTAGQVDRVLSVPVRVEDILQAQVESALFECITCVSTLEHIGFDVASDPSDTTSAFVRADTAEAAPRERNSETDARFIDAGDRILVSGGMLLVSVPAGFGEPILHQDSLGLFTHQFEYDKDGWVTVVGDERFAVEDEAFFRYDENEGWQQVPAFEDLTYQTSVLKPYATGCAMAALRKL